MSPVPEESAIRGRYGLVIALILLTYVASVTLTEPRRIPLVFALQLLTLWLVFTVSQFRRGQHLVLFILMLLAVLGLLEAVMDIQGEATALRTIVLIISCLLYLVAPLSIVRDIFSRPTIDGRTLLGAVAAYLMIGMFFAFLYTSVAQILSSAPFFSDGAADTAPNFLFFSFVTLTTTGYGNLVPAANPGQSLAVLEMIVGQLFLVTAVAKIISNWRRPQHQDPPVQEEG